MGKLIPEESPPPLEGPGTLKKQKALEAAQEPQALEQFPSFTLSKALEMQDVLIARYSDPEWQEALHAKVKAAEGNRGKESKARSDVTMIVQGEVLPKFGFAEGQKGVMESLAAFGPFNPVPEVAKKNCLMQFLINPAWQAQGLEAFMTSNGFPPGSYSLSFGTTRNDEE